MITIFCDFSQFSAKKLAFFLNTNVMIKYFFQNLSLFRVKNANLFAKFFGQNILNIITSVSAYTNPRKFCDKFFFSATARPGTGFSADLRGQRPPDGHRAADVVRVPTAAPAVAVHHGAVDDVTRRRGGRRLYSRYEEKSATYVHVNVCMIL
jgi:hypothetical protein